jgi:hypothetical protein
MRPSLASALGLAVGVALMGACDPLTAQAQSVSHARGRDIAGLTVSDVGRIENIKPLDEYDGDGTRMVVRFRSRAAGPAVCLVSEDPAPRATGQTTLLLKGLRGSLYLAIFKNSGGGIDYEAIPVTVVDCPI